MIVFEKEYDGESLYDLGRDIAEAIDETYNDAFKEIPTDEHGFSSGTFKVTIEWSAE